MNICLHTMTREPGSARGIPELTTLGFSYVPRTDAAWAAIGQFKRLKKLAIGKLREFELGGASEPRDCDAANTGSDEPAVDDGVVPEEKAHFGCHELSLAKGLSGVHDLTLCDLAVLDDAPARLPSLESLHLSNCVVWRERTPDWPNAPSWLSSNSTRFSSAAMAPHALQQLRPCVLCGFSTVGGRRAGRLCAGRSLVPIEFGE